MPDILRDFKFFPQSTDSFVSPLSDKAPTSFYSSITLARGRPEGCLKCGIHDLTQSDLSAFLLDISNSTPEARFRSPYFDTGGADYSIEVPDIPPLEDGSNPIIKVYDFSVLRYTWGPLNGTDLDTRTAFTNLDPPANGIDLGWSRDSEIYIGSDIVLQWGGDNTTPTGSEAVLIDIKKIQELFPDKETFTIRLRAFWYNIRANGNVRISFSNYQGGTMSHVGTNFVNVGGTLMNEIGFTKNITLNESSDIDGEPCGFLVVNLLNGTAVFA